jgi:hypothetical protein
MKRCPKCTLTLDKTEFGKRARNPDGLHEYCKSCRRQLDSEFRVRNEDKIKLKKQFYYEANKDHIKNKTVKFQQANPDKRKKYAKISRERLKLEIFNHYCDNGPQCNGCGEADIHLLTVDHIHGGGNQHKKEVKSLYSWIKREGFPEGFQILCWNCQLRKKTQEAKSENPSSRQLQAAEYVRKIKHEVLEHYGSVCLCGEADEVVLTLDHVNDDGASHRREVGARGFNFYMWLRKNGFPNNPPLQVLCANCQNRKLKEMKIRRIFQK